MRPKGQGIAVREWLEATLARLFPVRQIHLRTEGRIRFFEFSRRLQISLTLALAALLSWGTFATGSYSLHDRVVASKESQIFNVKLAYNSLLQEVASYQKRFSAVAGDLEDNHTLMLSLVEQNTALQRTLKGMEGELRSTRATQEEVVSSREELSSKLQELRENVQSLTSHNFQLRDNLDQTQSGLMMALQARNQAITEGQRYAQQAVELETRLKGLEAKQQSTVERLREQTVASIESLEKVVDLTGIDIAALLKTDSRQFAAQGGPFIPAKPDGLPADSFRTTLASLEMNLERWEGLQDAMRRLPLSAPLASFQISSGFGKRSDPINKRWAMHYGLDLSGPMNSPVYVTAPGKVTKVGWESKYGKMIEVDHGSGIRTRYGHLNTTLVKLGQKVDFHEKIGLLGNTGRSTGAHLHYEVLFQGRPMNPMDFMQAGRYVFKD